MFLILQLMALYLPVTLFTAMEQMKLSLSVGIIVLLLSL